MKRHPTLSDSLRLRRGRFLRRAARRALGLSVTGNRFSRRRRRETRDRRGSMLLVVIGLLGALTLLGLLFFTFATQEQQNAANFADAAKRNAQGSERRPNNNIGDDIEAILDESVRQLIVGGNPNQRNSALWMGRHSLIFNMFGHDLQPYSGTGVNLVFVPGTGIIVDQNRDVFADTAAANYDLRELNDSPATRNFLRNVFAMPAADVDYTYPDHNNAFLAYDSYTWDFSTTPPTRVRVVKPSFHRPELFRNSSGSPLLSWFDLAATSGRVFRPHPFHVYCPPTGALSPTPTGRFLVPADIDRNGNGAIDPGDVDFNGNGVVDQNDQGVIDLLPGGSGGFPFVVDLDGDNVPNEQGVWDLQSYPSVIHNDFYSEDTNNNGKLDPGEDLNSNGILDVRSFEYDVDNDDDGLMDSIWMDLDLPVRTRESDNARYIPLVAFKVVDLDSLINLNATGNLSGDTQTNATTNFGNGADISRSSTGLSPAEINPIWALDTTPSEATSLRDHTNYFGYAPANQRDLANMELWWLLKGRIEYSVPPQIHSGRFGDADRVGNVYSAAFGATPPVPIAVNNPTQSDLFPFPGVWNYDDNFDLNEGLLKEWLAGSTMAQTQAFVHPLALGGRGRFWTTAIPKQLDLVPFLAGAGNPCTWLRYTGSGLGYDSGSGTADASWLIPFGGALVRSLVGPDGQPGKAGVDDDGDGTIDNAPELGWPGSDDVRVVFGANGYDYHPGALNGGRWIDDPLEVTLEPKFINRPIDDPFEPHDSLFLHMSKVDRDRTGITSRFANLMPANIVPGTTSNPNQTEVARRFTADSWDPKTFGLPRYQGGVGPDGQPGQALIDDNGDGIVDDMNELGWPGSDDDRAWEFNADTDGDGLPESPPQFTGAAAFSANDPFRPQLRRLLSVEFGNTSNTRQPMRLSVNEFLDFDRRTGVFTGDPITDPLLYRALTPHSTEETLTTLPSATPLPAYLPTTEGEKEFWARRDRQQMARDIYVMLYTFCGGNDSIDPTTTPGNTVYTVNVRRQMAQFAVNVVDALDRDNCITMFEYDRDLSNGWGLDDDPTGSPANDVTVSGERDVVFGVEAQELTISETLWLYQGRLAAPQPLTPFDESTGSDEPTGRHNFVQIELRVTAPYPVNLASTSSTTSQTGIWRILRDDNTNGQLDLTPPLPETPENALTFLDGAGTIDPAVNTLFTIASSDSTSYGTACLYIDTAGTSMPPDFEIVAPNKPVAPLAPPTLPATTPADLDVLFAAHAGRFVLATGSGGDFLSRNNNPDSPPGPASGNATATTFRLERRMNPNLPLLAPDNLTLGDNLGPNPFIDVDMARGVQGRNLAFDPASVTPPPVVTQPDAVARLSMTVPFDNPDIQSQERRQPLDGNNFANCGASGGPSSHLNTIGQNNSPPAPAQFNLFQAHFDRDFASIIELFEIPLRGPNALTRSIVNARRPASLAPNLGQLENGGPSTFGGAVLLETEDVNHDGALAPSDDTNGNGIQDAGETDSNGIPGFDFGEDLNNNGVLDSHPYHFHRLLSLIEVPTRTHRQLRNPLEVKRVPGRINLNGTRDPRVLAALIDDRQVINPPERTGLDLNGNTVIDEGLLDATGDTIRDWWYQFLIARDGQIPLDPMLPYSATNPMIPPLPMGGVSQPFRDLGLLNIAQQLDTTTTPNQVKPQSPIENTIFRGLFPQSGPISPISPNGRRLFELANETEFTAATIVGQVEPLLRHRILSKMIGNTTTRSNVFVVYVTTGMFECVEDATTGAVRIGGQMDVDGDGQKDTHRAVFIIDRSQAEEAFDLASGTFDWKKLVKARQRIN